MTGYALKTGSTEVDLEKRSQPKSTSSDASIYPKPDRIVSRTYRESNFSTIRKPRQTSGIQPKLEMRERLHDTSLFFIPKEEVGRISQMLADAEASLKTCETSGLRADSWLVPKRQLESARGAESLPPTIVELAPKCWLNVVNVLALPP